MERRQGPHGAARKRAGPLPEGSGETWNVVGGRGDGECLLHVELCAENVWDHLFSKGYTLKQFLWILTLSL